MTTARLARIAWEPPNRTLARRLQQAGLFHAVPDEAIEDGIVAKEPGQALCSYRGTLDEPPVSLLPLQVTCTLCAGHVVRLGLTVVTDGGGGHNARALM